MSMKVAYLFCRWWWSCSWV